MANVRGTNGCCAGHAVNEGELEKVWYALKVFPNRNSKVTMAEQRYTLARKLLRQCERLTIYQMVVNGHDEFQEFINNLHPASSDSDHNFLAHFLELLKEIGARGVYTNPGLFKKLAHWQDIWEIRRRRGNVNHRFYGFMVGDHEFYIVRHTDKRSQKADPQDLGFVDRVRKTWLAQLAGSTAQKDGD
jgi:hypothetical protein